MPRKRLSATAKAIRAKERNRFRRDQAQEADTSTVSPDPVLTTSSLEYVEHYPILISKQQWHRLSWLYFLENEKFDLLHSRK